MTTREEERHELELSRDSAKFNRAMELLEKVAQGEVADFAQLNASYKNEGDAVDMLLKQGWLKKGGLSGAVQALFQGDVIIKSTTVPSFFGGRDIVKGAITLSEKGEAVLKNFRAGESKPQQELEAFQSKIRPTVNTPDHS